MRREMSGVLAVLVVENENAIHERTAKQANKAMTGQCVLAYLLSRQDTASLAGLTGLVVCSTAGRTYS